MHCARRQTHPDEASHATLWCAQRQTRVHACAERHTPTCTMWSMPSAPGSPCAREAVVIVGAAAPSLPPAACTSWPRPPAPASSDIAVSAKADGCVVVVGLVVVAAVLARLAQLCCWHGDAGTARTRGVDQHDVTHVLAGCHTHTWPLNLPESTAVANAQAARRRLRFRWWACPPREGSPVRHSHAWRRMHAWRVRVGVRHRVCIAQSNKTVGYEADHSHTARSAHTCYLAHAPPP